MKYGDFHASAMRTCRQLPPESVSKMGRAEPIVSRRVAVALTSFIVLAGAALLALPAPSHQALSGMCLITGKVVSSATPLPGVSVIASREGKVVAATSTDTSGAYRLRIPAGDYTVTAELAAFARFEREITVEEGACEIPLDAELVLLSRARSVPGETASGEATGPVIEAPSTLRRPNRLSQNPAQHAGSASVKTPADRQPRFSQLQVVESNAAAAAGTSAAVEEGDPASRLLPPGFST